jgi:serine/threonine-protein kinase
MTVAVTSVSRVCPFCHETYPFQEQHHCAEGEAASAQAATEDPLIGSVLGERYQIESFLSSGGMGVVYKARHVVLDKPVAIKLLRESQDPVAQQRFLLEAKSACHIGHEHIVDITDFGVLEDGRPYLVMEFLQGQSLETLLSQKGALPSNRVCRIGEQIARGLQAVHEKGIMHRDLKPGNIFLLDRQRRDFVKILDFGIAKVMAGTRETLSEGKEIKPLVNMRQTTQGTVLGTPEYLSPEQASGEAIDARVDIYALGCILYEMLTGDVPFRGNGPMSTLMKHLTESAVPPRQRRPDLGIPESLEAIVLRAMARDKNKRFPTMEALAEALQSEVEQTPTFQGDSSMPVAPVLAARPGTGSGSAIPLAYAPTAMAPTVTAPLRRKSFLRTGTILAGILSLLAGFGLVLALRSQLGQKLQPVVADKGHPVPPPSTPATVPLPDASVPTTLKPVGDEAPAEKPTFHTKSQEERVPVAKPKPRPKFKPVKKQPIF